MQAQLEQIRAEYRSLKPEEIKIQPADDLHIVHKVFFRNLDQPRQHRLADQEGFRKQKLHISRILDRPLYGGEQSGPSVAGGPSQRCTESPVEILSG